MNFLRGFIPCPDVGLKPGSIISLDNFKCTFCFKRLDPRSNLVFSNGDGFFCNYLCALSYVELSAPSYFRDVRLTDYAAFEDVTA
jgi:hypothetical protein